MTQASIRQARRLGLWLCGLGLMFCQTAWSALALRQETTRDSARVSAPADLSYAPAFDAEPGPLLLLDVLLDQYRLGQSLPVYQQGQTLFVPLGELARQLTMAIRSDVSLGRASGYMLQESRPFDLDLAAGRVNLSGQYEALDRRAVRLLPDDIYVDSRSLERWWPVRLVMDRTRMELRITALEPLPLQQRLLREQNGDQLNRGNHFGEVADEDIPVAPLPYRWVDMPFVDQTLSYSAQRQPGEGLRWTGNSSTFLTADLAGFEGSLYLSTGINDPAQGSLSRLTLARNDPAGGLLGAMGATQLALGYVLLPGISNLSRASATGTGFFVSNTPLSRSSSFDTTSFNGNLQPGWDVELYFNDALIGYQASRADATYRFGDLPLAFGENNFRLVFHGPQGQVRVEEKSLMLDGSILKPKQLLYSLGYQQDSLATGTWQRTSAQFEYGLRPYVSVLAGLASSQNPATSTERMHATTGVRAYLDNMILSAELARALDGPGRLGSIGLNTRVLGFSVQAQHTWLDQFDSEVYSNVGDSLRSSTKFRLDGAVQLRPQLSLPVSVQFQRDELESGQRNLSLSGRFSAYVGGTYITQELFHQLLGADRYGQYNLQASRGVGPFSFRTQAAYQTAPTKGWMNGSLAADLTLPQGYSLSTIATRSFQDGVNSLSVNLNRSFQKFSLRTGILADNKGQLTLGFQLSTSFGHNPVSQSWMFDTMPMAGSGAVAARVFLDHNQNQIFDAGDEPIEGAGFHLNNAQAPARTNAQGLAFLNWLPTREYSRIAINPQTLEGPQWLPQGPPTRLLGRPGRVAVLDFPIDLTSDLDGVVELLRAGKRRGAGEVLLELLNVQGQVVASTISSSDGYYLLTGVRSGHYSLRVSPAQLDRLGLQAVPPVVIEVKPDGSFLKPVDFVLQQVSPKLEHGVGQ